MIKSNISEKFGVVIELTLDDGRIFKFDMLDLNFSKGKTITNVILSKSSHDLVIDVYYSDGLPSGFTTNDIDCTQN